MSLMESFDRGAPVDPAAYVSEPEVTTRFDAVFRGAIARRLDTVEPAG